EEFVTILKENVAEVVHAYRVDTTKVTVELATCWAIVNGKLASGVVHCHPNSFLSGVYYVNTNDDSGDIFFQDPRHVASMWSCPVTEHTPWTIRQVTYHPVAGGMLIFPSWLYHGVEPNLSDAPRVSLSFNYRLAWLSPVQSPLGDGMTWLMPRQSAVGWRPAPHQCCDALESSASRQQRCTPGYPPPRRGASPPGDFHPASARRREPP